MQNATVRGAYFFLGRDGISSEVMDAVYNGTDFVVYHSKIPIHLANQTVMTPDVYVLIPAYVLNGQNCDRYDPLYTSVYNLLNPSGHNYAERAQEISAYCVAARIVK